MDLNDKDKKKYQRRFIYLLYAIGHSKNCPRHHPKSAVCENFDIKVFTNSRIQLHSLKKWKGNTNFLHEAISKNKKITFIKKIKIKISYNNNSIYRQLWSIMYGWESINFLFALTKFFFSCRKLEFIKWKKRCKEIQTRSPSN